MTVDEARAVLGVGSTASLEEIRDAFRELARRHHPDAGGSLAMMQQLSQAFEVLDEAHHDAGRRRGGPGGRRRRARQGPAVDLLRIVVFDDDQPDWHAAAGRS